MSIFGRNGKTAVEKDDRPVKFDARPPEVRDLDSFVANDDDATVRGTSVDDLVRLVEDLNRRLDVLSSERETTNQGIAAIKQVMASLTYGEMIDLVGQVAENAKGDSRVGDAFLSTLTDVLPATLHSWATE